MYRTHFIFILIFILKRFIDNNVKYHVGLFSRIHHTNAKLAVYDYEYTSQ